MSTFRCCRLLSLAAGVALALVTMSYTAFAQQVTYYDFDEPQSIPGETSYACVPTNPASILFCFNGTFSQNSDGSYSPDPTYLSDTYPAIIDPNFTDVPPVASTHEAVQMTPAAGGQGTSMWFAVPQKITSGFNAYFTFKFTPNANSFATADGIAFVIQNSLGGGASAACSETGAGTSAYGGIGGCIGYGGIDNSLAIEFDTYKNPWDPQDVFPNTNPNNDNHVAIQNCGAGLPNSPDHTGNCLVQLNSATTPLPAINSTLGLTMADGNLHQVVITYAGPTEANPNQLQVFIDPPFNPGTFTPSTLAVPVLSGIYNIGANLNLINSGTPNMPSLDSAYVGFTSATGAAYEQHEIMNWTFTPHTSVTQVQPIAPAGQPTVFPFGGHVYATTYPSDIPTTNISQQVIANTITPQLFSQLVAGGPFAGSQCQVYDETGGNCVVYSVSCLITGTATFVQCPTTTPADPIGVKSNYTDSTPAISPGYIQGDPFYNLVTSVTSASGTATVTCAGECAVTTGQSITLAGSMTNGSPSAFNGPITVGFADPNVPNVFTYSTTVAGTATGGYLTSNNVENVFYSYSPLRIDPTTTGKVNHFSDFVVTALTIASSSVTVTADTPNPSAIQAPVTISFTVTGNGSPNSTPTGSYKVTSSVLGDPFCMGTLASSGATCSLTFLTPGTRTLTIAYLGDGNFAPSAATVQQVVNGPLARVSATSLNFGTLYLGGVGLQSVTLTNIGNAAMSVNTPFLFDVGNGDSKEFIALSLCPNSLGVGKSCTIYVAFIAGPSYNTQTAILKIMDNAPGNPQEVSLTANVINPVASYSPRSVSFGTVSRGTSSPATPVLLTNTGGTTLNISSISMKGSNQGDFTQTNNCPASLSPNASCTISTTFKPTATGSRSAYVYVVDNMQNGSQQVALTGTGK